MSEVGCHCKNQAPNTTGCNHLYNTLELLMMGIMVPETYTTLKKYCQSCILLVLYIIYAATVMYQIKVFTGKQTFFNYSVIIKIVAVQSTAFERARF